MAEKPQIIKKKMKFGDKDFEVSFRKLDARLPLGAVGKPVVDAGKLPFYFVNGCGEWPELNQRTYEVAPGVICMQDQKIVMRDGIAIYVDVYLPKGVPGNGERAPAIIAWSPYGKRPCADVDTEWQTYGVPYGSHSNFAKFEGPDPLYWCHHGYAIINVDPRGINNSEGDAWHFGSQTGRDGYDLVEWCAAQDWCTGKVSMAGNSALAIAQWYTAAENPPHLTCIAPWEGMTDIYRERIAVGGIVEGGFSQVVTSGATGEGYLENLYLTAKDYPLFNEYWEDKIPKLEKITVPAYITAGWSHFFHLRGVITGYRRIKSKQKWFRMHRDFEWPDQYSQFGLEELRRFFDRFLKGIRNGWDSTPRVRVDVMDAYDFDYQTLRAEEDWPIPRTEYKKLYLDAKSRSLKREQPAVESKVRYDAKIGKATFDITFNEDTELTGNMVLKLWLEADGNDEMDLFATVQKLDAKGKWLPTLVMGHQFPGALGRLRVSLRETDPKKSDIFQPYFPYNNPQKLKPGEIVPVEIEVWPQSKIFHAGEQLRVEITGRYERIGWIEPFAFDTDNKGHHVIHTGGKYDSYLLVPVIPPKYVAGDKIYR